MMTILGLPDFIYIYYILCHITGFVDDDTRAEKDARGRHNIILNK